MRLSRLWLPLLLLLHAPLHAAGPIASPSPGDVETWCKDVTRAIPRIKLNTCVAADLKPWAKSVNGRDIMLREFTPPRRDAPRVLVIGGIHGDELSSVSIVFRWIDQLSQPESGAAGPYRWHMIPVL